MSNKPIVKLIALIIVIAFTATNCGISYAADSSKIRQMQPMETIVTGANGNGTAASIGNALASTKQKENDTPALSRLTNMIDGILDHNVSLLQHQNPELFSLLCTRSVEGTMDLTEALAKHPDYLPNRKLSLYYPASGWDVLQPLFVVMELLEREQIDTAECYYADTILDTAKTHIIEEIKKIGNYVEGLQINDEKECLTASFKYKGKPVILTYYGEDAEEVLTKLPNGLNLLYYHNFFMCTLPEIFPFMWKAFLNHTRRRVAIFTHHFPADRINAISEWYIYADSEFGAWLPESKGVVMGLDASNPGRIEQIWLNYSHKSVVPEGIRDPHEVPILELNSNQRNELQLELAGTASTQRMHESFDAIQSNEYFRLIAMFSPFARDYTAAMGRYTYLMTHTTETALAEMGIPLAGGREGFLKSVQDAFYENKLLSLLEREYLMDIILQAKIRLDPERILNLAVTLDEDRFNELVLIMRDGEWTERYFDNVKSLPTAAVTRMENENDELRIRRYGKICFINGRDAEARDLFTGHPAAQDKEFKVLLQGMAESVETCVSIFPELDKGLKDMSFNILVNMAEQLVLVDSARLLKYMESLQPEPGVNVTSQSLYKILLPAMAAICNLYFCDVIDITPQERSVIQGAWRRFNATAPFTPNTADILALRIVFGDEFKQGREEISSGGKTAAVAISTLEESYFMLITNSSPLKIPEIGHFLLRDFGGRESQATKIFVGNLKNHLGKNNEDFQDFNLLYTIWFLSPATYRKLRHHYKEMSGALEDMYLRAVTGEDKSLIEDQLYFRQTAALVAAERCPEALISLWQKAETDNDTKGIILSALQDALSRGAIPRGCIVKVKNIVSTATARASETVTTYEVVTPVSGSETINARAAGYRAESDSTGRSL